MKSSRCNVILAEVEEPPLYLGRQYLAIKHITKLRSYNSALVKRINLMNEEDSTNPFWRTNITPIVSCPSIHTHEFSNHMEPLETLPAFQYDYRTVFSKSTVMYPQYNDIFSYNKGLLNSIIGNLNSEVVLYTEVKIHKEWVVPLLFQTKI
ncbi:hypothetical protein JTB14_011497 [Gonioctena quinquepunctata]|nr:hypothetical protein JTB14_011497 [Gonioctena quinquepunctata]